MTETLPYGSWPSPVTAEAVVAAAPRLDGARFVGDEIWWGQSVPAEGGRVAVLRRTAEGTTATVLPAPWSARSRVHEYGGGAWTATDAGELLFVSQADQRVWALRPGGRPRPLTPDETGMRHGGLRWEAGRLLAVRERAAGAPRPVREIVGIPLDGSGVEPGRVEVLASGSDFVAQPALSADGGRLAWIGWDHPAMPWDRTRLCVRDLRSDAAPVVLVDRGTATLQPVWDGEGLLFADDPGGRWNLFRIPATGGDPLAIAPVDADTGGALWALGTRWFGLLADARIVAVRTEGADRLVVMDAATGEAVPLAPGLSAGVAVEDVRGTHALVTGAGPATATALWLVDAATGRLERIAPPQVAPWDAAWLPRPREMRADGPHGVVHAIDYPPTNPDAVAPGGELPPYLVWVHGGPTGHVAPAAAAKTAYFTSRGIGVLDVNYGGSTGYGRAYRERLRGLWGVVDVDDVAAAATGLAAAGLADPARLAIEGGSAGGWTVLAALTGTDVFAAGVSRYGVGDARSLAADTHDFESRYLDGLIGPLPEAEGVYLERSPLSHPERLRVPLLILQGEEDAVVPPAQAEAIRDALAVRGVPHGYVLYPGEGHGFRRRETMVHALESEYAFLGRVLGFPTPGVPAFEVTVGGLTPADGPAGREITIAPGAGASRRDLEVVVSHEPDRPLTVRTADPAWVAVLEDAGFTAVDADPGAYVLLPALDGA
ncbi:MAG: prolyl oligopeptidase family serine peptidase [Microbacterium sp.]